MGRFWADVGICEDRPKIVPQISRSSPIYRKICRICPIIGRSAGAHSTDSSSSTPSHRNSTCSVSRGTPRTRRNTHPRPPGQTGSRTRLGLHIRRPPRPPAALRAVHVQARFRASPRFNLPARKFPVSGHSFARPTPRSHDLLAVLARAPQHRTDDVNFPAHRTNTNAHEPRGVRCWRTHSCCAIAAAAATFSERVEPYCGM